MNFNSEIEVVILVIKQNLLSDNLLSTLSTGIMLIIKR